MILWKDWSQILVFYLTFNMFKIKFKWILSVLLLCNMGSFSLGSQKREWLQNNKMTWLISDGIVGLLTLSILLECLPLKLSFFLDSSGTWVFFFLFPFMCSLEGNHSSTIVEQCGFKMITKFQFIRRSFIFWAIQISFTFTLMNIISMFAYFSSVHKIF